MSSMPPDPLESDRQAEREEMVASQLARRGIAAEPVLEAMRRVPREWFVPKSLAGKAYADGALPIDCGQTISQPYMVARMTELLELGPQDRALEIGTGTGYQTAILACLCKHVFSTEWHLKLMTEAAERLKRLESKNVSLRCCDGSLGWPENAPFEGIIVTAGAPQVPAPLREQLAVGGRLVVPIGPMEDQTLVRVRRTESGYVQEQHIKCRFVKLWGAAGWRE
jgi:protein-L-isoaspartate(D-aspartate) O-methyltransferase